MLTLPNIISLLRIPLAFAFFQENTFYRAGAVLLAMISDGLDGYFARRYRLSSRFGTLLDPFTDKFFVFIALCTMIHENRLTVLEAAAMICRDFSVIIFGIYLTFKGSLSRYKFRAIWCGKITTVMQLTVLMGLTLHISFPPIVFFSFITLGLLALLELYLERSVDPA